MCSNPMVMVTMMMMMMMMMMMIDRQPNLCYLA